MTTTAATPTNAALLDLQQVIATIRRRTRFWMAMALVGLLAGLVVTVVLPAPPTAVTQLLIIHEDDEPSDGGSLMDTDIALIETTRIAGFALKRLGSRESPTRFLDSYQATGLTNNVLELEVTGSTDGGAVARAKAIADSFVADHVRRNQASADAEARGLRDQQSRAQQSLSKMDESIGALSAQTLGDSPAELESLYAQRAALTSRISDLGRRAEEAALGAPRVAAGTQITDAPRPVPNSLLRNGLAGGGIGLLFGLAAGLALTAVGSVVRDRPILRREIAGHLGASVIAQLAARRRGPVRLLRRSRGVAETRRVAATLVRTVPDAPAEVSLLGLGCAQQTATLAVEMAAVLAERGPVAVIDALPGRVAYATSTAERRSIRVLDSAEFGVVLNGHGGARERHIGVGSVEPGAPWTDLTLLGPETILVVRAGYADTAWLHTVARQLADAGIPVIGVVLVDPDPRDRTDGTLWDALHTALRGRASRAGGQATGPVTNGTGWPAERFSPVAAATPGNGQSTHDEELPTLRFAPAPPPAAGSADNS